MHRRFCVPLSHASEEWLGFLIDLYLCHLPSLPSWLCVLDDFLICFLVMKLTAWPCKGVCFSENLIDPKVRLKASMVHRAIAINLRIHVYFLLFYMERLNRHYWFFIQGHKKTMIRLKPVRAAVTTTASTWELLRQGSPAKFAVGAHLPHRFGSSCRNPLEFEFQVWQDVVKTVRNGWICLNGYIVVLFEPTLKILAFGGIYRLQLCIQRTEVLEWQTMGKLVNNSQLAALLAHTPIHESFRSPGVLHGSH